MARKSKNKIYPKPVKKVETLGTLLKSAREKLNFDIDTIHNKTRIPVESIRLLEDESWDLLPSPVYVRGFIKLYAREVNLDYSEIISLYNEKVEEIVHVGNRVATPVMPALSSFSTGDDKHKEESESRVSTALVVFILLILATLAISYFSSQKDNEVGQSPSAAEAANYDVTG